MPPARRPRPRRTWPQRLLLLTNVVVIVAALASAAALAYARDTVSSTPRIAFGSTLSADTEDPDGGGGGDEPINFLLVGADSIANLPEDHPLRNTRDEANLLTDTMIILRVDPGSAEASVLSIPRDLWVELSGLGWSSKINSALAFGGPETLVATIQDSLDIPISRYVQVDFNGFLELISVLGGIEVRIDHPLRDPKAQLRINQTGCVELTPEQALGYVRSRTLEARIDGEWVLVDDRVDLGRIERQQDFLVIALQKAFDQGLRNPNTLRRLVSDVWDEGYVQLDDRLTIEELVQLGRSFENFRPEELDRYSLPVDFGTVGEASVVFMREPDAQRILNVFRGFEADDISFRIGVRNGTGEVGAAQAVQLQLEAEGFNVAETSNADRFGYERTVIRFDPSQRRQAQTLARWLVEEPELEEIVGDPGAPIDLIVGADWAGLLDEPRPAPEAEPTPTVDPAAPTATPTPTPTPTPEPLARIRSC